MSALNFILLKLSWVSPPIWSQLPHNVFGSIDGQDIDVAVSVDDFPKRKEHGFYIDKRIEDFLKEKYYSNDPREVNAMLVKVEDGVITKALKGPVDETNNSLYYSKGKQLFPNLVTRLVPRDIVTVILGGLRSILSTFSRDYTIIREEFTKRKKKIAITVRSEVIKALKAGTVKARLECLKSMSYLPINVKRDDLYSYISFSDGPTPTRKLYFPLNENEDNIPEILVLDYNDRMKSPNSTHCVDTKKLAAANFAQKLALYNGKELYCKKDYSAKYPDLEPFLYREENVNDGVLEKYRLMFIDMVEEMIKSNIITLNQKEIFKFVK